MKKIAFIISGKSPKTIPGGLGAYSYNVAAILNDMGFKVYIIGFSSQNEVLKLDFATLIHFKNPYSQFFGLGAVMIGAIFVKKMEEVVDREVPDEVLIYGASYWGIAGVKLKKKLMRKNINVKTIVGYFTTFRHEYAGHLSGAPIKDYGLVSHMLIRSLYIFARCFYTPIERKILSLTDIIIIHYDSTRKILLNEFPSLNKAKIVKIPYYIDLYARTSDIKFVPESVSNRSIPTVSVICRQDPRKGINTFLKAVKILKERRLNFNCLIVGSGIFLNQNKRLAKRLGLIGDIKFLGFVDSVEEVLNNTDIYVLPSIEEGAGAISLLEAMKKGIAIVSTKCDGIPEDFIEGKTGILVTPGDANQMSDAIGLLLRDQHLRNKLAQNVKIDYYERFTFEKMKEGIRHILECKGAICN